MANRKKKTKGKSEFFPTNTAMVAWMQIAMKRVTNGRRYRTTGPGCFNRLSKNRATDLGERMG
jgi:hypothetical protein